MSLLYDVLRREAQLVATEMGNVPGILDVRPVEAIR